MDQQAQSNMNWKSFLIKIGSASSFIAGTWIWLASPFWYVHAVGLALFYLGLWLMDVYKKL